MKAILALLLISLSTLALARDELPLNEGSFVDAIKTLKTSKIAELLGEPQKHYELKDDHTGTVIGQVWQYEYLNTSEEGEYYPTTELDIVGDRVATVVFMNDLDKEQSPYVPTPLEEEPPLPECNPSC
ncbi:MAG: hypothetical protein K8Q92_07205 [Methylophilales bacterium]|nr:hypothetical protein [Methylophilales bacterium]